MSEPSIDAGMGAEVRLPAVAVSVKLMPGLARVSVEKLATPAVTGMVVVPPSTLLPGTGQGDGHVAGVRPIDGVRIAVLDLRGEAKRAASEDGGRRLARDHELGIDVTFPIALWKSAK